MSLTDAQQFECPYCMTINDIDIDPDNDSGQSLIVDCQICCQPIEITLEGSGDDWSIHAKAENE